MSINKAKMPFDSSTIFDPTSYSKRDWYRGTENLKRAGVKTSFTKEMMAEAKKCAESIEYFCEKYVYITDVDTGIVKFNARPYQKKFWNLIKKNRFIISKQGRQAGKTAAIVGYLLHYSIFHKKRTVGVAAQNVGQAREIIHRFKQAYEMLPTWLQVGVSEWQKGGVHLGNGTRIFASSSNGDALRGKSLSLLILDEFAHIRGDKEFMTSTFPVVSSGSKTKIVIISTPNGMGNAFYDIWHKSLKKMNKFVTYSVDWRIVPRKGDDGKIMDPDVWAKEMIDAEGKRKFLQEYAAEFVGSSNTLIDGDKIEDMLNECLNEIYEDSEYNIKLYKRPIEGHSYVITSDVGRGYGNDYSTFSIWDVTIKPYEQVGTFRDNEISTKLFPYVIHKYARLFNDAYVVIERNDAGGEVANILYYDIEYGEMHLDKPSNGGQSKPGLWTSKNVKRTACSNLRDMLDASKIKLNDPITIKELRTFEGTKTGIYNATKNNFDDMVQNCWMFAYAIDTKYIKYFLDDIEGTTKLAHEKQIERLMNELPAVGSIGESRITESQRTRILNSLTNSGDNKVYDLSTD